MLVVAHVLTDRLTLRRCYYESYNGSFTVQDITDYRLLITDYPLPITKYQLQENLSEIIISHNLTVTVLTSV